MYRHGLICLEDPVSRKDLEWLPKTEEMLEEEMSTTIPEQGIRHALVARVRREIAAGTYDTPDKWEKALGILFQHIG